MFRLASRAALFAAFCYCTVFAASTSADVLVVRHAEIHPISSPPIEDGALVIENGKILEHGTHHDLLRAGGHYHDLYTEQSMRDIVRIDNVFD